MTTPTQANQILLIEDDSYIATGLQSGLKREGYSVTWKANGQSGVDHARTHNPHLIILDIRLPDGSGFDFCRQMRQMGIKQSIILTVQREEMDKVVGLEVGADDYLTKPFSFRELVARIRAQLQRAYGELATHDADKIYIHDLVIDRAATRVMRDNQEIILTPTEFRLLSYLAQYPNQSLTRKQILDAVWGYNSDADEEKVVKVYIRRLCEKVEPDSSNPRLILTVPGVGYRLVQS